MQHRSRPSLLRLQRARHRSWLFLLASATAGACAIVVACTGSDPLLTSGAVQDAAGTTGDDATTTDHADGGGTQDSAAIDAVGPDLLDNGSFEFGNCEFWKVNGATEVTVAPGYDGGHACHVCADNAYPYAIVQPLSPTRLEPLGPLKRNLRATFYLRRPPAADASDEVALVGADGRPTATNILIAATMSKGADRIGGDELHVDVRTSAWTRYEYVLGWDPDAGADAVSVFVISRDDDNGCFDVDQVSLVGE